MVTSRYLLRLIAVRRSNKLGFDALRDIVKGKPNPLVSSFKLSYYTLLNLLRRVEGSGHDMEYVIRNSFQQFQFEQSLPEVRCEAPAVACALTCVSLCMETAFGGTVNTKDSDLVVGHCVAPKFILCWHEGCISHCSFTTPSSGSVLDLVCDDVRL